MSRAAGPFSILALSMGIFRVVSSGDLTLYLLLDIRREPHVCKNSVCLSSLICMVGFFVYVDTVFGFMGILFMLSLTFKHDYFDTCCFECLICMRFVFLHLHLFSAIEHVSHGKAL